MAVPKRWTSFTRAKIEKLPNTHGMYEIADKNKNIIYRGSSDSKSGVKGRLISHLIHRKFPSAVYFRYVPARLFETGKHMEAKATRKQILQSGKKPRRMKRTPILRDIFGNPLS